MEVEFRCAIHAIEFGVNWKGNNPEGAFMQCPLCIQRDHKALAKRCVEAERHRDALLECIDIKLTLQPLANTQHEKEKANGGG